MQASQSPLHDPEDFSDLYTRTQGIIFRYIYGMLGGPIEEVEDLTCDTFLRAWKGRKRFWGGDHDALCWLFTIARHLVIDAHRRRKNGVTDNQLNWEDMNIEELVVSTSASPEEQAADREQFKHLWIVLQELPDEKREVLLLRYMLGWKVKEIAGYLDKEENTVSVYIQRCLEQIRQAWVNN